MVPEGNCGVSNSPVSTGVGASLGPAGVLAHFKVRCVPNIFTNGSHAVKKSQGGALYLQRESAL